MTQDRQIPFGERGEYRKWFAAFTGRSMWGIEDAISYMADNPAYQVWRRYDKPSAEEWLSSYVPIRDASGRPTEWQALIPATPFPRQMTFEQRLEEAESPEDLLRIISNALGNFNISEDEADVYYDQYYRQALQNELTGLGVKPEVITYLSQAESKGSLAERLLDKLQNLDDKVVGGIYEKFLPILPGVGETALTGAREQQETEQLEREQRARNLSAGLQSLSNNPLVTQKDMKGITAEAGEAYLAGESDEILSRLAGVNQQVAQRSDIEGRHAEQLLGSLSLGREPQARERGRVLPGMPDLMDTITPYLEETGLGKGTKLREFIASQLPDIARETAAARKDWWRKMHPGEREEEATYYDEQNRYRNEAARWQAIAGTAPSSAYAGGTYYGPGGLKAIAEKAYEHAQSTLGGLREEDYRSYSRPQVIPDLPDPFLEALKKRKFRTEYFRQPGAGLAPSLTPAVRF